MTNKQQGLLLFAHGARDPNWALPFKAVLDQLRASTQAQQVGLQAELAFLEFMQPDLPEAAARLLKSGCQQVDIVPLFLGAGGHVRKDLPALLETLRSRHPDVDWQLRPAIGEMPEVIAAMTAASLNWIDTERVAPAAPAVQSSR